MIKRILFCVFSVVFLINCAPAVSATGTPEVSAKSAVLIEAESRNVIFEKNSNQSMPMASTTKIMTALVALENCILKEEFTVCSEAVGTEGTSAYLQKGDTLTYESALYALLLQSANDVAVALAADIGETVEGFVALMNAKAKELALSGTHFQNPSGLPAEGHYTTATDLARLSAAAMENEVFQKIVSTKSKTVKISGNDRTFVNHNKLLSLYDGAIGIKTGFTKESGRCLVGAAERDGVKLISVTLSARNDWNDHRTMFDYGFDKYVSYTLFEENEFIIDIPIDKNTFLSAAPEGEKRLSLPKNCIVTVKVERQNVSFSNLKCGDTVASAVFFANGTEIYRVPLKLLNKVT